MQFSTWALLVGISVGASLLAFFWGLRSGQFSDPERARFLPLVREKYGTPPSDLTPGSVQKISLWAVAALGFAAVFGCLLLTFYWMTR